ncbi:MAG: neutral/alkaline non-lysosomal ceramidase N-terminal domain-containing protein [Pirellulales bacterium]|nr:neutral/alkaline non-lysosomal ceramidase N-terminal domain-containing protein [Pirellulales bacterium]
MRSRWFALFLSIGFVCGPGSVSAAIQPFLVGAAKLEITPEQPALLAGYGSRATEHEGVDSPLWARALAIDAGKTVVLIAVDNCGIPAAVTDEVARRIAAAQPLPRSNIVICATHTHSAPTLTGYAPVLWEGRMTPEQEAGVARYTAQLTDQLVAVAQSALQARQPANLYWGQGRVNFGGNRRVLSAGRWTGFGHQQDGPVDHSFPLLVAKRSDGSIAAIWMSYACHCTTCGDRNTINGDWAGFANEYVEQSQLGAVALCTIGCGADVGPQPTGSLDLAQRHGRAIEKEVRRLLASELTPLTSPLEVRASKLALPLSPAPGREHWQKAAAKPGFDGVHARRMLRMLDQDGALPSAVPYPLTAWAFGDQLALIFLPGEVVVDYAVRLKQELDWTRVWINGWSNDVPCYVPSRRVLLEGGYEADFSMIYYGWPARFDPAVEEVLVGGVTRLVGPAFARRPTGSAPDFFSYPAK